MSPVELLAVKPETETSQGEGTCVGDLSLVFQASGPGQGRDASAAWQTLAAQGAWTLWQQPPGKGWKGSPLHHMSGAGWQVWLLGELYGWDGDPTTAELRVLAILTGQRPASELNGHFLLWAWQAATREWHVWTDRFGSLHAYYAHDGQRAALGTFFPAVAQAASRRRLDWIGLTGFFGFGFFPQDRTHFDDVRILGPASHFVFDAGGGLLHEERYWQWHHVPDAKRSYEDTVAEFERVFAVVMREQLRAGRIAVPISGGLDSRTTVAVMNKELPADVRRRLWAYSYGYAVKSAETRIARQVAQARGLPFSAFTIAPYLFDRLELVMSSVEGFQDVTQCRQASAVNEISAQADFVIAAHWGDVWLDDMGMVAGEGPGPGEEQVARHALGKMVKRGGAWLLENLCAPHLGATPPATLLEQIVREDFDRLRQIEDPDFRVKVHKTDHWSFRWTLASLRMFQAGAFPRLPFYDTRLADFFCTVPSTFVQDRRLQIDYLKRFAPDLARIRWQAYDANLYQYQHFNSWLLPKRAMNKARRLLMGQHIIERNWEVQFRGDAGQTGLQHWLLRPGLRLHELVPQQKIEALLEAFRSEPLKEGRGYTVSMLLTFSAWLERYG